MPLTTLDTLTIKSSRILTILYIYARQLQAIGDEQDRSKGDQNIETCRLEYIEAIWGDRLRQPLTTDFYDVGNPDITKYRTVLKALVQSSKTDSVRQNILDLIYAYIPYAVVNIVEYWQHPELMVGYDWQSGSMYTYGYGTGTPLSATNKLLGWGGGSIPPGARKIAPNYFLKEIGFIQSGVQIFISNLLTKDEDLVSTYLTDVINTFIKPAGLKYVIIIQVPISAPERTREESTRDTADYSAGGFGVGPFGGLGFGS